MIAAMCISYLITEGFCGLFAFILLQSMGKKMGCEAETRTLSVMIETYLVYLIMDILSVMMENRLLRVPIWMNALVNAVAISAVSFGCFCWFWFVSNRLGFSHIQSTEGKEIICFPLLAICALDLTSVLTGWLFWIDAEFRYHDTPLFWAQGAVNIAYLLIPSVVSAYRLLRNRDRDKRGEYAEYALFAVITFATLFLEDMLPDLPFLSLAVFAALLIFFQTIYVEHQRAYLEQEKELAEYQLAMAQKEQALAQSRMSIMLSQIQPHFLYNALVAIQAMCVGKAPEAERAVVEFSQFLRGNLDSLSQTMPIPFAQELSHTRNYLSLEISRFGGDVLRIEYRVEATDFRIPALSLQPIVENAVRYGVMQREEGGTIRISSVETPDSFRIVVEDDGVGFDIMSPKQDGRTHIGITNVRNRIQTMCNGTLEITSTPGQGTVAVIVLPKGERLEPWRPAQLPC